MSVQPTDILPFLYHILSKTDGFIQSIKFKKTAAQ